MIDVTETAPALVDIWSYVDSIDQNDLGQIDPHDVSFVYRDDNGLWEHILIDTCIENVHLVVVIDRPNQAIIGHHLLNLNVKYGLGS